MLKFLVTAASEIRRKFQFLNNTESILKQLTLLSPKNVFNCNSLVPLFAHFIFLHSNFIQNIDSEYRSLINYRSSLNIEKPFHEFWIDVSKIKCGNELRFENLYNFITNYIFILPHSSANVERVFSINNNNKIKSRMSLKLDTLNGILHTKELLKYENCFSFKVSNNITEKFNTNMYDFKRNNGASTLFVNFDESETDSN